jgi:antitoxin (DNA-binding transcriptional repressor) of toxin-antitoxin stability system
LTDVASRGYIGAMKAVGVRELKNRLSEYLRLVRNGEEILVTDRGEVVAELRQPSPRVALPYPALLEVVRQGRARVGLPNRPDLYPALGRVMPPGTAARLLDEERGGR